MPGGPEGEPGGEDERITPREYEKLSAEQKAEHDEGTGREGQSPEERAENIDKAQAMAEGGKAGRQMALQLRKVDMERAKDLAAKAIKSEEGTGREFELVLEHGRNTSVSALEKIAEALDKGEERNIRLDDQLGNWVTGRKIPEGVDKDQVLSVAIGIVNEVLGPDFSKVERYHYAPGSAAGSMVYPTEFDPRLRVAQEYPQDKIVLDHQDRPTGVKEGSQPIGQRYLISPEE